MKISSFLTKSFKNLTLHRRHLCNLIREELTVQTFCDIHVHVPYNVRIKPLDVHKYHNCDLLRIELDGVKSGRKTLKHIQDGNNIKIFASMEDYDAEVFCNIRAPVKANLSVTTPGDIIAGAFSGSKMVLKSTKGNIFLDKFQGDNVELHTNSGDIVLKGAVVATNIQIIVANTGSIKTKRLQGLNALLKAREGSINVESSYCDNTVFEGRGELNLHNVHKSSTVNMQGGQLNISGLDGQLEANLDATTADIQISRILEDSTIRMTGPGDLKLAISDECQLNTLFEINTKNPTVDPSLKLIHSKNSATLYLTPMTDRYKCLTVDCQNGAVNITGTSWINMFKLNVKK